MRGLGIVNPNIPTTVQGVLQVCWRPEDFHMPGCILGTAGERIVVSMDLGSSYMGIFLRALEEAQQPLVSMALPSCTCVSPWTAGHHSSQRLQATGGFLEVHLPASLGYTIQPVSSATLLEELSPGMGTAQ